MATQELLDFAVIEYGTVHVTVFNVLQVLFILTLARVFTFLIQQAFRRAVKRRRVDRGTAYALRQLINYMIWIITILFTPGLLGR